MVGNHSISLLTDAWVKGIRTFDPEKALKAYAHEAMNKGTLGRCQRTGSLEGLLSVGIYTLSGIHGIYGTDVGILL